MSSMHSLSMYQKQTALAPGMSIKLTRSNSLRQTQAKRNP
jgi:hypothetical protein